MKKITLSFDRLPKLWSFVCILVYSILAAQYYQLLLQKTTPQFAISSNAINWGLFIIIVISCIIVWLFSTFIFHLFSLLLGGVSTFGRLLRNNSFAYIVPAICLVIAVVILRGVQIPATPIANNIVLQNPTIYLITSIINGSFIIYFIMVIFSIKYLYQLNFLKSIAAVVIPVGIIYLFSLLFSHV